MAAKKPTKTAQERLADRQKARADARAELAEPKAEQELSDLDALEALEAEHGADRLAQVDIAHAPGFPTVAVVRTPNAPEMKRFRDTAKGIGGRDGDYPKAQEELADTCVVYASDREVYQKLVERFPSLKPLLAEKCILLAAGREQARAKL